jgi:hypothetical protein
MHTHNILPFLLVIAALSGCAARRAHNIDTIRLTPEQEKDVFVASGNLGPETSVIVLSAAPKTRYENGAIVITGGRELHVVQPHAWRTYTGTAISAEEAARLIARAERLEVAIRDVGAAASDLRLYLESRSQEAKTEAERMREKDKNWRAEQERQAQSMLEEASRLRRSRDQEMGKITHERDEKVAAIYKTGSVEIQALTDGFSRDIASVNERYAALEAREGEAYVGRSDKLARDQKLTMDMAVSKQQNTSYIHKLEEGQEKERQNLNSGHTAALARMQAERDSEIAKMRADAARKIDDSRRLYEAKAERTRKAADTALAEVRAKHVVEAVEFPPSDHSGAAESEPQLEAMPEPASGGGDEK